MPSQKVHCAISKKRTGKKFEDLHNWIDEHHKEMGVNHRTVRHSFNLKDKYYVKKEWGQEGVVEWLFHIALDNLETSFKEGRKTHDPDKNPNFFRIATDLETRYIYFDCDRKYRKELIKVFKKIK